MMSGIYIVPIVGHICTKQNKYLDVFIFIFLTIIALSLMATLSWCGVVLLWPDKYNVNSFIPIYKTPLGIIQTVLYIGAIEGGVMSAFGCLMKWFFGKYETEKKHPLVAAMETRAEE